MEKEIKLNEREMRIVVRALEFIMKQEIIGDKFKEELKPIIEKIDDEIIIV